jgi:hypothetical protein
LIFCSINLTVLHNIIPFVFSWITGMFTAYQRHEIRSWQQWW